MLQFTGLMGDPGTTKRKILSQAFSVWDPQGLLLPFSIRSKIILQNLNRMKYEWDDELKEADLREWHEWCKEAEKLDEVRIPRAYFVRRNLFERLHFMYFATPARMPMARVRTQDKRLQMTQ